MANVYIVQQQPGFDMTPALKFGEIKSIFPPGIQVSGDADTFVNLCRSQLRNVTPDDYFIPTGDPLLIMIASHVFASNNDGIIKTLKWDRRLQGGAGYVPININMEAMPS